MSSRISFHHLQLLLGALILAAFPLLLTWLPLPSNDSFPLLAETAKREWFEIANFTSNAFHTWRRSWALGIVADALTWAGVRPGATDLSGLSLLHAAHLLLFEVGLLLLLWEKGVSGDGRGQVQLRLAGRPVLPALVITLAIVMLFGPDLALLGFLAPLPLLIFAGLRLQRSPVSPAHLALLAASLVIVLDVSNQLALLVVLVAALCLEQGRSRIPVPILVYPCLLLPALLVAGLAPIPSLPPLPSDARVTVAPSPVPVSLVGPYLTLGVIDGVAVRAAFRLLALILLVVSALMRLLAVQRGSERDNRRDLLRPCLILSAIAALDVWLPPGWAPLAPAAALARAAPGLAFFPLAPFVVAAAVFCLLASFGTALNVTVAVLLSIILMRGEDNLRAITQIKQSDIRGLLQGACGPSSNDAKLCSAVRRSLSSPSAAAIRSTELNQLRHILHSELRHLVPLATFEPKLRASHQSDPEQLKRLMDRRSPTRWTSGSGKQYGNEWVEIAFKENIPMLGLRLRTAPFLQDFPRGIRVRTGSTCSEVSSAKPLIEHSAWPGPIAFTPEGNAYFDSPSRVDLFFPSVQLVGCLLVEQIGVSSTNDWSIADVSVIAAGPAQIEREPARPETYGEVPEALLELFERFGEAEGPPS